MSFGLMLAFGGVAVAFFVLGAMLSAAGFRKDRAQLETVTRALRWQAESAGGVRPLVRQALGDAEKYLGWARGEQYQ